MDQEIFEKIKKEAENYFDGVNSCHELEHTQRVLKLALNIAKKEKADLEVVKLSALLHDVARKEQDESAGKIDHAIRGAILAKEILQRYNINKEKINNICHSIECHRYRNNLTPKTIEAKILYDADKLDAIGAIGIGRAFSFAGHIGAKVHNKGVNVSETKEYSKDDTAWREYNEKLKFIKNKMLTKQGKKIAKERHTFMEIYFKRLNQEVDGKI